MAEDINPSTVNNTPIEDRKDPKWGEMTKKGLVIGRGDTKKIIPPDEVEKLARLWCTYEEIAQWFNIPVETLKYNFRYLIAKGKSSTKQALRRAQIDLALKGNAVMLIWLGKNILDQQESPLGTNDDNKPLPWSDE